jgi:S-adenosylmethionine hydrolase
VGGERKALALHGRDGRVYVGPDNGVLSVAPERLGGLAAAVEIANPDYMVHPVSATFHGRDVFAPAAAHLARGVDLADLGPPLPLEAVARLELPRPRVSPGEIVATVLDVDRFGNVQLNVTSAELGQAGIQARVEVDTESERRPAVIARTFAAVAAGETVVYEDAYGSVAVAVNRASAAEALRARVGTTVTLRA